MNIIFVQPNSLNPVIENGNHIYNFESLGIYYLASMIKQDNDVSFIDMTNESRNPIIKVMEKINSGKYDVVVFSALSSVKTGMINRLCREIKEYGQDVVTIVGGPHASLMPTDFDKNYIDFLIKNNSLDNFEKIITGLNDKYSIEKIKKGIIATKKNSQRTLSRLPKPLRKMGAKYKEKYRISIGKPGISRIRESISSIKTSSGCPFRCNFCCLWQLYPNYEKRNINEIIEEINELDNDHVFFADDESMIDTNYMNEIALNIVKNKISKKFVMYARVDTIAKNEKLLENWALAGLKQIWIGLEGCTNPQLERYNKRNTIYHQEEAIRKAHKYNISIHATALVDHTFSKKDFDAMYKYTKNHLGITSCHFFILTPFRGTAFYNNIMNENPSIILTQNPDHYSIRQSVLKPTKMSIDEFHYEYAELQKKFNSDTIPFECTSFINNEYKVEYEEFKNKNDVLYQKILSSHNNYETSQKQKSTV